MSLPTKTTALFLAFASPGLVCPAMLTVAQDLAQGSARTMHDYYQAQLAWVDSADPQLMLEDDISAGRSRFFSVCGYSCNIPGVGDLNYDRCYSAVATVQVIEGTTDVTYSKRHGELVDKAGVFATEYNRLLAARLDALGKRLCPRGEDWDALFNKVAEYVLDVSSGPLLPSVGASTRPAEDGYDFRIDSPKAFAPTPSVNALAICAIVVQNGVRRRVTFLTTTGPIGHPHRSGRFSCALLIEPPAA